jgi:DDE superfamily endonuclease
MGMVYDSFQKEHLLATPSSLVSFIESENGMKPPEHTTPAHLGPTLREVSRWYEHLRQLHARLRPHFARPEVHQQALRYLQAVLSDVPRKNGWQLAEQARQAHPYGMQRLLSQAVWDQEAVRDEVRRLVSETLRSPRPQEADEAPFPVLVLDESGFPKRGRHSAGVGPQYCGRTGRVENCQVGVFLSYVTAAGHALIDRELYLPQDWCADPARRQAAHIPEAVRFATKPELGQQMIERAQAAGLPIRWVVADTALRAQSRPARLPGGPGLGLRASPSLPSRWSVCKHGQACCSQMWPALPSKPSARGIGSVSPKAWVPKASASLTGLACPSCMLGSRMVAIGSWCAAAWTTHTSWPTTWSGRHPRPLCPPWWLPSARAGASKRTWKRPKPSALTTMKSAATWAGTAISPSCCWRLPSWSASPSRATLPLLLKSSLRPARHLSR